MEFKGALGAVLKWLRVTRGRTQEDFSLISSRTYISWLERGGSAPTIEKLNDISKTIGVHPATLLIGAYALWEGRTVAEMLEGIAEEIDLVELEDGVTQIRRLTSSISDERGA
jgi:transcriptional regulator with XRE-family HTH domain